jgi:hypothetical protein
MRVQALSRRPAAGTRMVMTVNIICPQCGQVSEIFLSTRASVVVLSCPSCLSPLIYLRRKTFLLDKPKLKKYRRKHRTLLASRLLEQIADADTSTRCAVKRGGAVAASQRKCGPALTAKRKLIVGRQEERYISEDDCINLRIELALCPDSKEFISHL